MNCFAHSATAEQSTFILSMKIGNMESRSFGLCASEMHLWACPKVP